MGSATERGTWTGKLDFLLSCLGYAVGLGNIWRFPYLCYKNGGGAFLIPYFTMLFTIGMPIFLLELGIGQYSAKAPITLFKNLTPIFKGVGYCIFITTWVINVYYNMIIGWTIYYLFASFTSELPWEHCGHEFNTANCFSDSDYDDCKQKNGIYNFGNCYNVTEAQAKEITDLNITLRVSAAEEYLNRHVLGIADDTSLGNMGRVQWTLALSSLAAWALVCASLIHGIKSSGKVVYFTATFPYLVITILLVKGLTLPGALNGIKFYLVPDWQKVADPGVWKDAAVQIFYSLSIASGGLITLASYNKFDNNIVKDTLLVCIGNCLTSFYAGFAIFSVLGYMAYMQGEEIESVVNSGSGLAFVAYPRAVLTMWCPPLWSILFFLMLLTLGLDSMFAGVENIVSSIVDEFPKLNRYKPGVLVGTCVVGYLLGLPLCCQGGRYLLDLLDHYGAGLPFLFTGFCECVIIAYFYGLDNFFDDMAQMLKKPLHWFVRHHLAVLLLTVAPFILLGLMVLAFFEEPPTSGDYVYPRWGHMVGWVIALVPVAVIPFAAVWACIFSEKRSSAAAAWSILVSPTDSWRDNAYDFARESIHAAPTELSTLSMINAYVNSSAAPHPYPHQINGLESQTNGKASSLTAVLGGNRLFNSSPVSPNGDLGSGTFIDSGVVNGGNKDRGAGYDNEYDEPRSRRH